MKIKREQTINPIDEQSFTLISMSKKESKNEWGNTDEFTKGNKEIARLMKAPNKTERPY